MSKPAEVLSTTAIRCYSDPLNVIGQLPIEISLNNGNDFTNDETRIIFLGNPHGLKAVVEGVTAIEDIVVTEKMSLAKTFVYIVDEAGTEIYRGEGVDDR